LVLRIVTELVALVSYYGVKFPHIVGHIHQDLTSVWDRWDAGLFIEIAKKGYLGGPVSAIPQHKLIAFAPLFPWVLRVVHAVGIGWVTSGLLVSAVATVIAVAALYRLVELDGSRAEAATAVTLLAVWPTAFFLLVGYADALALAAVILAFVFVRQDKWMLVGLLVAIASMAKYDAAIVLVALGFAAWGASDGSMRRFGLRMAASVVPSLIWLGVWMAYCSSRFDSALAFARAQRFWGRGFAWPWTTATHTASSLFHLNFLDTKTYSVTELFDAVTVVLLVVATIYAFRKMQTYYGVLLLSGLALFVCEPILLSVTREVILFFALFIVLARWSVNRRNLERLLFCGFLPLGYFLIDRFVNLRFAG